MTILDTINDAISRIEQQHDDAQSGPWRINPLNHFPASESVRVDDETGENVLVGNPAAAALILTLYGAVDFLLGALYAARYVAEQSDLLGGDEAVQHRLARSKTLDAGYRLANIILGRDS